MLIRTLYGKEYLWTFGLLGWIPVEQQEGEPPIVTNVRHTIEKQAAKMITKWVGIEE